MTHRSARARPKQEGFSLIEVLVTLVILLLALLGLVGLMVTSQRSQQESYQRVQAIVLVQDMVNRINTNRQVASCYVFTTEDDGTPYLGTDMPTPPASFPACTLSTATAEQKARAVADLTEWNSLLKGSAEQLNGGEAGAMLGARGCVREISAGLYEVSVVWQGNGKTVAPPTALTCGTGLYGDETQRRAVSMPVKIANIGG